LSVVVGYHDPGKEWKYLVICLYGGKS
jgi:hypothetical protein